MPHKHKRKRDDDASNFDLAPNAQAKPLAAYTKASLFTTKDEPDTKRCNSNTQKPKDDTPKAFARMMAWQSNGKRPNGLDDGTKAKAKATKKQKTKTKTTTTPSSQTDTTTTTPPPQPRINPGESLSEFSQRVDATLPLSIRRSTSTTLPPSLATHLKQSQRTTKHNRRLQRMQSDWRTTETHLREKAAAAAEDLEDEREEQSLLWRDVETRRKKAKDDDDPWKQLERKRRDDGAKQRNLQDVVKAPPALKKVKSKFKVRRGDLEVVDGVGRKGDGEGDGDVGVDVKDVPSRVGSLRRREEMNRARRAVIDGYRKMRGRKMGVAERINLAAGSVAT